jgi:class 3 adenylate cyclase/tetratricopeptide (TPR) repeat protein
MTCASCGRTNRTDARFCDACGASLAARPVAESVARKVVTIVFADMMGSTSLQERLDAEAVRRLMDRYYRELHAAVDAHGGTVVKLLGDGVMAAFGVPRVGEDDAVRAVHAAVDMQRAFRGLVAGERGVVGNVGLRVAVNTGEVVVGDDHADVVGDPVNVAARLQEEAHDGDVLIGESTRRLVGDVITLTPFGSLALKGRAETVAAYRVVSLERPAVAQAIAFVGRDEELRRIMAVHETAAAGRARLAVVLGSPGLGKSRLLAEVTNRLGERATVLTARCDATGGATFAPLAGALRAFLRIEPGATAEALHAAVAGVVPRDDAESGRVTDGVVALLAGTPGSPEETFFVVRRLLAALGTRRPLVLSIDDVQWAEPLLLDLIEHLVQWGSGVPLLILAAARPELRDLRAALATRGGLVDEALTLSGLDASAATRLAANVVGAGELPAAVAGRVLATSEGNPLFVGELVRMLVHDGVLRRVGDRWVAGATLAGLEMPPSIQALLAARIERLRPEECSVLERAAVIGREFSRDALSHLLPPELRADLDAWLDALQRSELIEPDAERLRFHHGLIRDAAYRRLLKGTRAELHARFAGWLEVRSGEATEQDETIGWHLEQAHQHLRELGSIDEQGRALGSRAAERLAAAGRRALARDDLPLAASLLGRALDRLDATDPARADLELDRCEALLAAGAVGPAAHAIGELGRFVAGSPRLRAWHTCFAGQLAVLTDPQALRPTADAVAIAANELGAAGDPGGEAKAHSVHALALARLGEVGASEAALDRALAAARRAHDRRRANVVLAGAPPAALWGPSPVARASGRCLDVVRVLRITQGAPAVEAVALRCQGVLEALRGRTEAARRMVATSRHMVEELGITHRLLEAEVFSGLIELLEGDAAAAEPRLRTAYDGLRDHGLGIDAAQAAALLGKALLAQGRAAEAEALSIESEALAGDDLKSAIAWRGVRAEALARRGQAAAAVDFARAAVDLAAATDHLLDHADARRALATALRAAGRHDEAATQDLRAIELWDAKGATLLADRARGAAGSARPAALVPDLSAGTDAVAQPDEPAATTTALRFANRASRSVDAFARRWEERDWGRVIETFAPSHRMDDRRKLVRLQLAGEDYFASLRMVFAAGSRWAFELLATRGERLALFRVEITSEIRDAGASLGELLWLVEVGADGRRVLLVTFDPEDLDAAGAEMDARFEAGEAACDRRAAVTRAFVGAFAARDWPEMARLLSTDIEVHDHRLLGWEPLRGCEAYVQALNMLVDLAPDVRLRIDHVRMRGRGFLCVTRWLGTHQGSVFEAPSITVSDLDGLGRARRFDQFDVDQLDAAWARLDAVAATGSADPLERLKSPNAATAAVDRVHAAFEAGDWVALRAACAPDATIDDRRRVPRQVPARPVCRRRLLGAAGERVDLEHIAWTDDAAGEQLVLSEVDDGGGIVAVVLFDPDDWRHANEEAWARWLSTDAMADRVVGPMARLVQAGNQHDRAAIRRLLSGDFVFHDHRRTGQGHIAGADAYMEMLDVIDELAPVVQIDDAPFGLVVEPHGTVGVARISGTLRSGGSFESYRVNVSTVAGGRLSRLEVFEIDDLAAAVARLAELRPHPSHVPADAAAPTSDRRHGALGTGRG